MSDEPYKTQIEATALHWNASHDTAFRKAAVRTLHALLTGDFKLDDIDGMDVMHMPNCRSNLEPAGFCNCGRLLIPRVKK